MTAQDFYTQQSQITEPGKFASLYDAVPDDVEGICRVVQNLIVHYFADPDYKPPEERWGEIDTRYTTKMLQRIVELDDRPLTETRPFEKRFVGCCRDFTVLAVSILRHKGIPARARYGTSAYFEQGYFIDHVIVEYWNGQRWAGVDAELSSEFAHLWDFDIRDVPRDRFLVGGRGWQMCREEGFDPERFGLGPNSPVKGWGIVVCELLLDLAALNGEEQLCWEGWGLSADNYIDYSEEDKALLDRVARVTQQDDNFSDWAELFQQPKLALPNIICSWTPAADPADYPIMITLDT